MISFFGLTNDAKFDENVKKVILKVTAIVAADASLETLKIDLLKCKKKLT